MPIKGNFYLPPVDYYAVTGRKWQVTGFKVPSAHPDSIFLDHSTGMANALFSGAIEGGQGYYTTGATGIYSASGQYDSRDLTVSWGIVNPATNLEVSDAALLGRYLEGFEVNFYDETGKFYSGINFVDDGSIQKVDLLAGGSGYLSPTVVVTGVYEGGEYQAPSGTGAYIRVRTLGSGLHKSGDVLSVPESGMGYLSGIYHVDVVSGGSGYTQDTVLLITGSGGPGVEQDGKGLGSGANLRINRLGLGKRYGYSSASQLTIPYILNRDIFGGTAKRKYQIEVIAVDYYNQRTTGRLMVDFPAPRLGNAVLTSVSDRISFNINPPTETFGGRKFENISLQDIAIYRDETQNFEINNQIGKSNFLTTHHIDDSTNGNRLANFGEITISPELFTEEDAFRGYYYKFLPIDAFGTGEPISYATGIRVNSTLSSPEAPSGLRLIVDPEKTIGTNIEGATITNTYLTWKKDRLFSTENYEITLNDDVEKQSHILTCTAPSISGIDYMVSGTGATIATNDQEIFIPLPPAAYPRKVFDIFTAYGAAGLSWSAHTITLDEKYLPKFGDSFDNARVIEVPAGNTTSGYVYFSGNEGYTTRYVADNRLLENEGLALVARNIKNQVLTEYEPRVKIPTKKDGEYSIKIRGIGSAVPSVFSRTVSFTAEGNSSHFAFTPGISQLRLGGTGDITVSGDFATTVGGSGIIAVGSGVVVVGGLDNRVTGEFGALVGGSGNRLIGNVGDPQEGHFLGGGALNTGSGQYAAIVGGIGNTALSHASFLGGGQYNYIPYDTEGALGELSTATSYSLIGGGMFNTASGTASAILGGRDNRLGANATIGGPLAVGGTTSTRGGKDWGSSDGASYSTIAGGQENELYASHSFIGGGYQNIIHSDFSHGGNILGGDSNIISGTATSVGDAILAGHGNKLVDAGTALVGGYYSSGTAGYSLALGAHSWAAHKGAFVLSDSLIPSAEADGTIAKKSHGEDTLNLFFENGVYIRNGGLFISGDLDVSGTFIGGGTVDGGGAAGYVASWNDVDTLQTGGLYNLAGGNVGIGVITPQATLQVNGDTSISGELKTNKNATFNEGQGDYDFIVKSDTLDDALFVQGSDGFVGVGANPVRQALHVEHTLPVIRLSDSDSANTVDYAGYLEYYHLNNTTRAGLVGYITTSNGDLYLRNEIAGGSADGGIILQTSSADRMRIREAGQVGIGTALPSGILHVNNAGTGIIVANEHITGNAFEVHGAQGNLLTITDDLSDSLMSVNDAAGMPVFEVFADDTIKSYRNNETKFEIDPDNNRIRLRDNTYVSGNLYVSGSVVTADGTSPDHVSGLSGYFGKVGIGSTSIDALGDGTLTRLQVSHPSESFAVNLKAAGTSYIPTLALSTDRPSSDQEMGKIKWMNNGASPVAQIKAIRGSSDTVGYLNFQTCNAHAMQIWSDQKVQIASSQNVAPQATLVVDGDASISGELKTSGNLVVYRDNGMLATDTVFEVEPNNNRIRLRDHVYISGDLVVSGDVTSSSATHESTSYTASAEIVAGTHVSGLSGYFGKVGIGTTVNIGSNNSYRLVVEDESDSGFDQGIAVKRFGSAHYGYLNYAGGSFNINSTQSATKIINNGTIGFTFRERGLFIGDGTPTASLVVDGDASITGELRTAANVGINAAPIGRMHVYQSGDSQPALLVEGSQGSLFSVEDSLTGSLMSVNDIAGLPVFEAFDDGTIVMGQYNSGDFIVTGNKVGIGTSNPDQLLDVRGNVQIKPSTGTDTGGGGAGVLFHVADDAGPGWNIRIGDAADDGSFNIDGSYGSAWSNRFHIKRNGGNVGIGTTDVAGSRLRVDGDTAISGELKTSGNLVVYRDNGMLATDTVFEVEPNNNRIRLRDHTYVSGNLYVSGAIISADDATNDYVSGLSGYFGKVGIGTTSILAPTATLSITDNSNTVYGSDLDTVADTVFINAPKTDNSDNQIGASIAFGLAYGGYGLYRGASIAAVQTNADVNVMGLSFYTSASTNTNNTVAEAMRIEGDGKVAIGTNNPDGSMLRVNGDVGISGDLRAEVTAGGSGLHIQTAEDTANRIATALTLRRTASDDNNDGIGIRLINRTNGSLANNQASGAITYDRFENKRSLSFINSETSAGGAQRWIFGDSMPTTAATESSQKMLLKSDGKLLLGIGDSPTALLTVSGDASITGELRVGDQSSKGITLSTRGSNRQQLDFVGTNTSAINAKGSLRINYDSDGGGTNDSIYFARNDVDEAGTVDMAIREGNVGIGTTSPSGLLELSSSSAAVLRLSARANAGFGGIDFYRKRINDDHIAGGSIFMHSDDGSYAARLVMQAQSASFQAGVMSDPAANNGVRFILHGTYGHATLNVDRGLMIGPGSAGISAGTGIAHGSMLAVSGDASITGELRVDIDTLVVDAANDRVGIGTAVPECLLDLTESIDDPLRLNLHNRSTNAAADATISFETQGQMDWGMGIDRTDGNFKIGRHNTLGSNTIIQLDGAGTISSPSIFVDADVRNVGIGTSNPGADLHVYDGGTCALVVESSAASSAKLNLTNTDRTWSILNKNSLAGALSIDDGSTSRFAITSGSTTVGNVGINTTAPSGALHVNADGTGIIVANSQITGNAFEVHGAQGNLLTITDDLSDSLMSVNDAAGMPVFEVFADDTIKSYRNNESKFEIDPDNNRIRLRDHVFVSGDLVVSGDVTSSSATHESTSYTASAEIVAGTHVSGLSGYFGKVGIGSSTIDEDAILQVTKPDVVDPSRTEVARFLAITADGNTNSSLRVSSAVAGGQTSGRYVDLSVFDHNPTSRPLILQRNGGQVGIATSLPDGATLKVNGDASITGEFRVNRSGLFVGGGGGVLSNDRVGIGLTNPSYTLHVKGPTSQEYIAVEEVGGLRAQVYADATNGVYLQSSAGVIRIAPAGSTKMIVKDNGEIGMGTTTTAGSKLRVNGDVGISGQLRAYSTNNDVVKFAGDDHCRVWIDGTDGSEKSLNFSEAGSLKWKVGMDNGPAGGTADSFTIKNGDDITPLFAIDSTATQVTGALRVQGKSYFRGSVYAQVAESDTVSYGNMLAAPLAFWGTYCAFRQGTDHGLNLDVYNGGAVITPLSIKQDGKIQFSPAHNTAPEAMFVVSGDASITGELRAAANVGVNVAPIGRMHVYQSGDSQPALLVEGSQGSLFSVEDSLTGSLMSVNDIAGLPVFEAFDDGTIVMGQYNSGDFIVTGNKVGIGTDSPDQLLHLYRPVDDATLHLQAVSAGDPVVKFTSADNRRGVLYFDDGSTVARLDYNHSNTTFEFKAHNVSTVDASISETLQYFAGDVAINTASADGSRLRVDGDVGISGEARFNEKVGIGIAPDVRFFVSASEADVLAKFINTDTTNGIGLIVKAGGTAADKYVADFRDGSNNTRLKIFADGRTDVQGGDIRLRDHTYVSGNLYVSGSVVTADGTSPDHVSGLSGYFGKVGIGSEPINDASYAIPSTSNGLQIWGNNAILRFEAAATEQNPSSQIQFAENANETHARIYYDGSTAHGSAGALVFGGYGIASTSQNDFMTIDRDGKISIGNFLGGMNSAGQATLTVSGDASITGELRVDNNLLVADAANDKVGIGTSSQYASEKLSVNGSIFANASDGNGLIVSRATVADDESGTIEFRYGTNLYYSASIEAKKLSGGHTNLYFYNGRSAVKNANPTMTLDSLGNVGIGPLTSAPAQRLHVLDASSGWQARFSYDSARYVEVGYQGLLGTYGTNGNDLYIGTVSAGASNGHVIFKTINTERARITRDGKVGIGTSNPSPSYLLTVNGGLTATYKSFLIDHPTKPDKKLAYGSSETDEHNVFVRGIARGKTITLPDVWPDLVHENSITVQLTSIGDHQELYVESIKDNRILINNKKQNKINCFYLVHAERKDIGKLEVEPDKCNKE